MQGSETEELQREQKRLHRLIKMMFQAQQRTLVEIQAAHHNLRNKLQAITLDMYLMEHQNDGGGGTLFQQPPSIRALGTVADQALQIVQSLRKTPDLERAVLPTCSTIAVEPVVSKVFALIQKRYPQVELSFSVEGLPWLRAWDGEDGLEESLLHLLSNACEGDGVRGASRVSLRGTFDAFTGACTLEVADDGPGFPAAWLSYEPFGPFQTLKSGRLGLGLYLADRWSRASGGRLTLANQEAGGACVLMELVCEGDKEATCASSSC